MIFLHRMQNQISEVEFDCYLEFALGYYKIIILVKLGANQKKKKIIKENKNNNKMKKKKERKKQRTILILCTSVTESGEPC